MAANWTYGPLETALFCALMFVGLRFLLRRNWAAFVASIVVLLAIGDSGQAILDGFGLNTMFFTLLYATISDRARPVRSARRRRSARWSTPR